MNSSTIKSLLLTLFAAVCLILLATPAYSQKNAKQKKEQLQQQMKKLQDEIKTIQAAIKNTSAKKQKSMSEILSLQAKIKSRQKLIANINAQMSELDESIAQTTAEIETKAAEVERMKAEYASLLRKSYENSTLQNQAAFIFSSSSFYEAIQRYNYLVKIADYRRGQAKALQESIAELQLKRGELETNRAEQADLLEKQTSQKTALESEKKEKDAAVAALQKKADRLKRQSDEKRKAVQQLNNKIQAIIEEEIREAKRRAEELARKNKNANVTTKANESMPLTPEERALSNSFANNMGKLPWPVSRGHVISAFGKHPHPALKGVTIENNGVDIRTENGSDARAVFGGTVVSVFSMPTTQNCVIIKHGEYFTVYSNLETVSVKPNETVTTKQNIGSLHLDKSDEITKVHIEIWKGKEKLDPEIWLAGN